MKLQQLMKTTNVSKTKSNEAKAWFRSALTPIIQESDRAYPTDREACTRPSIVEQNRKKIISKRLTPKRTGKDKITWYSMLSNRRVHFTVGLALAEPTCEFILLMNSCKQFIRMHS